MSVENDLDTNQVAPAHTGKAESNEGESFQTIDDAMNELDGVGESELRDSPEAAPNDLEGVEEENTQGHGEAYEEPTEEYHTTHIHQEAHEAGEEVNEEIADNAENEENKENNRENEGREENNRENEGREENSEHDEDREDEDGDNRNPELDKLVEKELESVGLGKNAKRWRPGFSLDKIVQKNLGHGRALSESEPVEENEPKIEKEVQKRNSRIGKHKRETKHRTRTTQSEKYKKLLNAVQQMRQKREGEELIGELYGENNEGKSVENDDYPSIRSRNKEAQELGDVHFEEPLVYSMH